MLRKYRQHFDKGINNLTSRIRPGSIWPIFRLFNKYYLKSFYGPFFTFISPPIILGIVGTIMDPQLIFAGVVAMGGMSIGLTSMPFSILELKSSVIMKRIGSSPVKTSTFTFVIISYHTFMIILSILWLMPWALIFFQDTSMFDVLGTTIGFFGFFYGNVLNVILSLAIGFAIASFSRSGMAAQVIGMIIYFPSSFLSGQLYSIDAIVRTDALNWLSRFTPARYTTMIVAESWKGDLDPVISSIAGVSGQSNPFIIHDYYVPGQLPGPSAQEVFTALSSGVDNASVDLGSSYPAAFRNHTWVQLIYDEADHIVAYVYPYLLIIFSTIYTAARFRWSS